MGASNVAAVFARWTALPDGPFRALTFMANTSLDTDDPPRYWGGRDALAHALGYADLPKEPTVAERLADPALAELHDRARSRAFQAVKRATRELTAVGVLERVTGGVNGHNSVYALHLLGQRSGAASRRTRKLSATAGSPKETSSEDLVNHRARGSLDDPQGDARSTPARRSPDEPLRGSPSDLPGGHPVTFEGDTGRPPKEEVRGRGEEGGSNSAESSTHLRLASEAPEVDDDVELTEAIAELDRRDERCPHGVRGGLTRNHAARLRCPACRRSAADVPA